MTEIDGTELPFAWVNVPGQRAWLYIFDDEGSVSTDNGLISVTIRAGQMIIFNESSQPSAVTFNPIVLETLRSYFRVPISTILQPTLKAQISNRLALIGIDFVTLVSYITYSLILVSIILFPLFGILQWRRKAKSVYTKREIS